MIVKMQTQKTVDTEIELELPAYFKHRHIDRLTCINEKGIVTVTKSQLTTYLEGDIFYQRSISECIEDYDKSTEDEFKRVLNDYDSNVKNIFSYTDEKVKIEKAFEAGVKFARDMFNNPSNSEYVNSLQIK